MQEGLVEKGMREGVPQGNAQVVPMQATAVAVPTPMMVLPSQPAGMIAPVPVVGQPGQAVDWTSAGGGLADCGQDCEVCFWGTFCSLCLYGQIKARTGRAPDCWSGCMELTAVQIGTAIVGQVFAVRMLANTDPYAETYEENLQNAQAVQHLCQFLACCVTGYLLGKTRASMQAQYGYQARGIPASGVAQSDVPLDGNNFAMHCIPFLHPCALCEEARVAKANTNPNVPIFSKTACQLTAALVAVVIGLYVLFIGWFMAIIAQGVH